MTDLEATKLPKRPGWPEAIVGLVMMLMVGLGAGSQLSRLGLDRVTLGLVFTGWSALAGLAGFIAAWLIHRPPLESLGIRSTSRRWLLVGIGAGICAFVLKGLAILGFSAMIGMDGNPQSVYAAGGSGGPLSLILSTLLLGVATPLGEEFLFRGVITNMLLRYGAVVGVTAGALIFAVVHGFNIVLPAALIEGLIAGEVFRRAQSIWPAVLVHVVYNLPTIPLMLLASDKSL